jgi:hypothetical protein
LSLSPPVSRTPDQECRDAVPWPADGIVMNISPAWLIARVVLLSIVFTAALDTRPAAAQNRPRPVGEFAAGALVFADDGLVSEALVGGTARFYASPRISVGPEIAYIRGDSHSHLMLTGNLTFDLIGPSGDEPRPITPFVVAGGGLFRTRHTFPKEIFTSTEGAFTAGGGVRARVGKSVFVGAEARIGWESHIRLNGMIGVRLGR